MTQPIRGTRVSYPAGETASEGVVVHVADTGAGRSAVIVDATAFHPVDTAWPDQPADRGALRLGDGRELPIVDAVVAAIPDGSDSADDRNGEGMRLGRDVPVRTGTPGWTFVVAHIVEGTPVVPGDRVTIHADAAYRRELSAGHTACHVASLALDAALADAWRKDVAVDALGAPAFDALAIQESRILPNGSRDTYRVGKSLRRKGFDPAALDDLAGLAQRTNELLARWLAAGGDVRIERDGELLADRRTWVCELPGAAAGAGAEVRIPCGGTHVSSLSELAAATVAFERNAVEGGVELVMTTTATPAASD